MHAREFHQNTTVEFGIHRTFARAPEARAAGPVLGLDLRLEEPAVLSQRIQRRPASPKAVGLACLFHGLMSKNRTCVDAAIPRLSSTSPTKAPRPLGYATGQFGKNHLTNRNQLLLTLHGFESSSANLCHLNGRRVGTQAIKQSALLTGGVPRTQNGRHSAMRKGSRNPTSSADLDVVFSLLRGLFYVQSSLPSFFHAMSKRERQLNFRLSA